MDLEIDVPKPALLDWKKTLVYIVPAALLAGLLIAKVGARKGRLEEEYVKATRAFVKWEEVLDHKDESFASLESVVKKHPELQAHYDSMVGQNLLAAHATKEARPYIERTLKRTAQPLYDQYAQGSLMISERKYEEALKGAQELKGKLQGEDYASLYAFNLMRIAVLSQQLGDQKGELEALREIKRGISNETEVGHAGFQQLLSHFTVQETSLLDYIQSREEEISN